jgi:signal peptidase I
MKAGEQQTEQATREAAEMKNQAQSEAADWRRNLREMASMVIFVIVVVVVVRCFVIQAFKIPSGSMLPTLQIGDHLMVNRFIYGLRLPFYIWLPLPSGQPSGFGTSIPLPDSVAGKLLLPISQPKRGDVIVFRFPPNPDTDFIKRVVGLPGDMVEVRDKVIYINGGKVADTHAHFTDGPAPDITRGPRDEFGPVQVPEGHLFVMGDNRDNSYDSRFWGFVPEKNVLGKAFILYWSWDIDKGLLSSDRFSSIRWSRIGNIIH